MVSIRLEGVTVRHGGRLLLDGIHLEVGAAERVVVLGPSGSGKTTLLRAVAGTEDVAAGAILIDGRDVTGLPPRHRDVAMVDQRASLQPHLDVRGNVSFPLELHHVPHDEVHERVEAQARTFSLTGLLGRRPGTLSAGQRHEAALARSLVRRASILLFDEPFARTDPSRRDALLRELIQVQEGYGVTLLAATNDPRVAMGLGHRLAVLDAGRLVQVGTPTEVFGRPASVLVAGLVGTPAMNLVPGHVRSGAHGVRIDAGPLRIPSYALAVADLVDREVIVGIRPTDLVAAEPEDTIVLEEAVRRVAVLGAVAEVTLDADGIPIVAVLPRPWPRPGELVRLRVDPTRIHLFAPTGPALMHGI